MDGVIIPVLGVIAPFLTAVLILLVIFVTKLLRDRSKNEVLMKALEKGVELSPDFFKTEPVKSKKEDPLTSALVAIGLGIGVFIALYFFFGDLKFAAFGFIPLFIGLGKLIGYLVNKKKGENLEQSNIEE
ncbi:MAG: DUF6249 domain-containing protein [Bacteroidales bacterium]|nr:DUF6249 domain-containing protein [Bacteroidales bacterium]